jgi:hypothetical protein
MTGAKLSPNLRGPRLQSAAFQDDNQLLPLYFDLGDCVFPEAGQYSFAIYSSARDGGEALEGRAPVSRRIAGVSKNAQETPRAADDRAAAARHFRGDH